MKSPKERNIELSFRSGPAELHSFLKWDKGSRAEKGDQEGATRDRGSPGECAGNRGHRNCFSKEAVISAAQCC